MTIGSAIPLNALVVVADHTKALFFINRGPALAPSLSLLERVETPPNPRTHEQGDDRPGRAAMGSHRSAYSETDWHERAAVAFMIETANRLEALAEEHASQAIVLAAPPRALADLRKSLSDGLRGRVVAEVDKDLTHLPVAEIVRHLSP